MGRISGVQSLALVLRCCSNQSIAHLHAMTHGILFQKEDRSGGDFRVDGNTMDTTCLNELSKSAELFLVPNPLDYLHIRDRAYRERTQPVDRTLGLRIAPHMPDQDIRIDNHANRPFRTFRTYACTSATALLFFHIPKIASSPDLPLPARGSSKGDSRAQGFPRYVMITVSPRPTALRRLLVDDRNSLIEAFITHILS